MFLGCFLVVFGRFVGFGSGFDILTGLWSCFSDLKIVLVVLLAVL